MENGKKLFALFFLSIISLLMISCANEHEDIVGTNNAITKKDIIGTWRLTEIRYDSSGVSVTISPEIRAYSLTLKFEDDNLGQILIFDSGKTKVQNISWYLQNNVLVFINENNKSEYIRCELDDQCLCIKYTYITLAGNQVLALYVFTKEE